VRLNSSKAFSLLELLVVIALLGIVSLVAIPNVREWLVKREMEKMKKYMDQKTKSFYANDLPKYKENFEKTSGWNTKKDEVIKHEHKHLFENSVAPPEVRCSNCADV
jgi:prepilin-type N-terminal cleavage/methylation domain-containing protein